MQSTASPSWYRSIRGLALAVSILLGAQMVLFVARVFAYLARIRVLHQVARGEFVAHEKLDDSHTVVVALDQLWVFVFIATWVVWLVWQHRAQANAQHLTTKKLTFSPGWAVGWWFVPFANLVQPFRSVRELWRVSGGAGHEKESSWPTLALWWIVWLAFELLSSVRPSANNASAIAAADEWRLVSALLGLASAALAIAIVQAVVRRQETRIKLWPDSAHAEIPLPPPPRPDPFPE